MVIPEGEVPYGINITSIQEGEISSRLGSQRYATNVNPASGHSLHRMITAIGNDAVNPIYFGDGNIIWRIYNHSTLTNVTSGLSFWNLGSAKWEAVTMDSGEQGAPITYFAHPTRMLMDNGSFNPIHQWGINPIFRPVQLGLGFGSPQPLTITGSSSGNIVNTTITSATLLFGNYYRIVPASMTGIVSGLFLYAGATALIVDNPDSTGFFAYDALFPSGTLQALEYSANWTADGTTQVISFPTSPIEDWAFNGVASNGYVTDDPVSFFIGLGALDFTAVKIRILVNGSSTDWYEYSIPLSIAGGGGSVISVAKSAFTPVGLAGSGGYAWNNVSGLAFEIDSTAVAGTPTFTLLTGAVYASGGGGPDSQSVSTALPYNYVVTARDPVTGMEGYPSQPLIPALTLNSFGRPILVNVPGADNTSATGNPAITGPGSLSIYRSGGNFADNLYRFVGYAVNPGVSSGTPLTIVFTDTNSDTDIANAAVCQFDNYPPVPASLATPLIATLSASYSAGGFVTISTTWAGANLNTFLTQGSTITIGSEVVTLSGVAAATMSVWLQLPHVAGETVTCDAVVASPCDIACVAGDAVLLAGNANSPHVVFRSKAGGVEQFPIINQQTGNAHQQIISSPDDPINGLVDWGGTYVALTQRSIYTFQIWLGQFLNVIRTPADRGMIAKHLWCKVGEAIWFLSYDGIYAWAGGGCVKMSEQIDPIFYGPAGPTFNTKIQWSDVASFTIGQWANKVRFAWIDVNGIPYEARYDITYKRWEIHQIASQSGNAFLTALLPEPDNQTLSAAIFDNVLGYSGLFQLDTPTNFEDINATSVPIPWQATLGYFYPEGRTTAKLFQEINLEILNPTDAIDVAVYYDFSLSPDSLDSFTIAANSSRRFVSLPLGVTGGIAYGHEARVMVIVLTGSAHAQVSIYCVEFDYTPLTDVQRGRAMDWSDLGHPHDKRLYECVIDYNTFGATIAFQLDTITGKGGNTQNLSVQQFTLTGAGRAQVTLPIIDGVICKKVRISPVVPSLTTNFEIFSVHFTQVENYPPDVVPFTPTTDKGYPLSKYWQQVILDVNTNGIAIPVFLEVDGVNQGTISVTSTLSTRDQAFVMNPVIVGKRMRLVVNTGSIPTGGMFQLFNAEYVTVPADKGGVEHSFDFDDLGSPYDKRLLDVSIEYDFGGLGPITVKMDIILNGVTIVTNYQQFTLNGSGRSIQTFAITIDTLCTAVRLYPATTFPTMKMWKYKFNAQVQPPAVIPATDWSNVGWPCDKTLRGIEISIDTGGVACSLQLQVDGTNQGSPFSVNTTSVDTMVILTVPSNITGKMFRLIPTPGSGGKAQIYTVSYDVMKEPCARTSFDSYELSFGTESWKFIKQMWVDYQDAPAGLTVQIYVEQDTLFFTTTLPAHADRDVERFYLPDAVGSVYNKSRIYRIVITSTSPFKMYMEASRIEWKDLSGDQRASYRQFVLSEATMPATV